MRVLQCISRGSRRICFAPEISKGYEEQLLVCIMLQTRQLKAFTAHLLHIEPIVVTVLVDKAVRAIDVLIDCLVGPPLNHISSSVESSPTVIESVRQFVSQNRTNRPVIQSSNKDALDVNNNVIESLS
ncbi:hypothetical protein ACLKA7_009432 [Drosophila subpalustris]